MSAAPPPTKRINNTAYLKQKKWKAAQAAAAASPSPSRPSSASSLSLGDALKWLLITLVANVVLSRMITETWTWNYEVRSRS
jgi:hypothetical protein